MTAIKDTAGTKAERLLPNAATPHGNYEMARGKGQTNNQVSYHFAMSFAHTDKTPAPTMLLTRLKTSLGMVAVPSGSTTAAPPLTVNSADGWWILWGRGANEVA